jgi:hypothetical protein
MFMFHAVVGFAVLSVGYAFYKHMSFAQIKTIVATLEAAAVTDAKAVLAAIKTRL